MPPVTRAARARSMNRLRFLRAWTSLPEDLRIELLYHFTIRELQALSESVTFGNHARRELRSRLSAILKKWGLDVDKTLAMLGATDSVMSGSAVLFICSPGKWWPSDLDFYCPLGAKDRVVGYFEEQGYSVEPKVAAESPDGGSNPYLQYCPDLLKDVVTMRRGLDGPSINVIESSLPCAEAAVFVFHSTEVMNVLTSTGVVCYYPELTLSGRGVANYTAGSRGWDVRKPKDEILFQKYRERGYAIEEDCRRFHGTGDIECVVCASGFRHSGEDRIVRMSFEEGNSVGPAGRTFAWRLGFVLLEPQSRNSDHTVLRERGAIVVVQGDGDGLAFLYHGLSKQICVVDGRHVGWYL